jgi:N-methylhydantoinase B
VLRDLAHGFISPEAAAEHYNLDRATIDDTLARAKRGDIF